MVVLTDEPLMVFLFLLRAEVDSSRTLPNLRFVPASAPFAFFCIGSFCSALDSLISRSLGRGPSTPRQVGAPQRHCCTFFCEYGLNQVSIQYMRQVTKDSLKIIVISKLFTRHDTSVTRKKSHTWLPTYSPFLHSTIGGARMVDEPRNRTAGCVNDHVLVKVHQIITLHALDDTCTRLKSQTYLIVLIDCPHAPFTLILCDDLARVLHNDLVRLKCTVAAYTIPSISCLNDLHSNVVFPTSLGTLLKFLEAPVAAVRSDTTVGGVTFVVHESVLTVFVAASLFIAKASRKLDLFIFSPKARSIADKNV